MTLRSIASVTVTLSALALAGAASAQHAGFVLFGDPAPGGATAPAEHRFVHPVTSPYYHEDAFITSDVRGWFVRHDFPRASLIGGGSASVAAVQLRLALTERLGFVAYKDGYTWFRSGLVRDDGWNDLAAGLKYAVVQDWENQFHLALGAGYELSVGDTKVLQDDSEFRLFAAVNKGFGPWHLGGTVNWLIASGSEDALGDADRLFWHLHLDYRFNDWFSPVVELNGYHVIGKGTEVLPFQGVDVANFGGGDDVITVGLGAEFRPFQTDTLGLRAAFETPITHGDDLWGWRMTFSLVWSF
ncbi:MAG: hypothetical protein KF817_10975 [Phycisphaeraceae bacterium]|nr:hypothetical protein [Phycisphaeraceae bacterium]